MSCPIDAYMERTEDQVYFEMEENVTTNAMLPVSFQEHGIGYLNPSLWYTLVNEEWWFYNYCKELSHSVVKLVFKNASDSTRFIGCFIGLLTRFLLMLFVLCIDDSFVFNIVNCFENT